MSIDEARSIGGGFGAQEIEGFIEELENGLRQPGRDRGSHPFMRAVEAGEATTDQIAGWLHQFCLWADQANKWFGNMYAVAPDEDLREMILENILEEEGGKSSGTAGHVRLIENALHALGWTDERIRTDTLRYESWAFLHWLEIVMCRRSFLESAAAVSFAAERLNPEIFGRLGTALESRYSIPSLHLTAFTVHASEVEEEHGRLGPEAIQRYARTERDLEMVRFSVIHTAELYYRFFDVWRAY